MSEITIQYLPAIGLNDKGEPDYFWSDWTRELNEVDTIILHAMINPNVGGQEQYSALACRNLLNSLGLSTHYMIDRLGKIFQCVDEVREAWHAGRSKMPDPDNRRIRNSVNPFSVSIELLSDGQEFTDEQYVAAIGLVAEIMTRLPIENILGHSDVATTEVRAEVGQEAKTDPGENFNWTWFLLKLKEKIGEERFNKLRLVGKST